MYNYIDSKIISILKFVNEPISPTHINEFINYQLEQRFDTSAYKMLTYTQYNKSKSFYLILTLNSTDIKNSLYLKALEFADYYESDSSFEGADVFIYSANSKYFFTLYIDGKMSFCNSIYLDKNISLMIDKIDDFVLGTFGLHIDNIFIIDKELKDLYQTTHNLENEKITYLDLETKPKEVVFSNMIKEKNEYNSYLKYVFSIFIVFVLYLGIELFSNSFQKRNKITQANVIHQQNREKKDFVEQLINISDDLYSCKIVINQIELDLDIAIVDINAISKNNLLECLNDKSKSDIEILSTTQNQDGSIDAKLKYYK